MSPVATPDRPSGGSATLTLDIANLEKKIAKAKAKAAKSTDPARKELILNAVAVLEGELARMKQ